ncbi:hypothetical protein CDD81_598 [Ophiocordyceps australis]|uniref:GH18 domain-containing protein n=1 Tax=Ophiocordyceps australis TaxID=1399860 RepID=A0A2C5YEP2_9HYPO|nr:hypothetical protein CDD81_598 [Ophiocordyceps australis]
MHGQWDHGSPFSNPGCPKGNCLRSQVNRTETEQSFSMITKAGVASHKVMVGLPLYGRSFQMTQPGCYTEMCTFTGPESGAVAGKCTNAAGYISNWEIDQIVQAAGNNVQHYSSNVAGDIIVYNSTQWISYMKPETRRGRRDWARSLGFGGTSDWAMDLETSNNNKGSGSRKGSGPVYIHPSILTQPGATIACEPPCTFIFPPWTLPTSTVISREPVTETILELHPWVENLGHGTSRTVFVSRTTITTISLSPVTTDTISLRNIHWTNVSQTIINLTSSVRFPPTILTESPLHVTSSSTASKTVAGIMYTYSPEPYSGPSSTPTSKSGHSGPPSGLASSIHVTVGPAGPTCVPGSKGCGSLCEGLCDAKPPCIGICGCIGLGCPGGGSCVGFGCDEDDDEESSSKTPCSTKHTVTDCQVDCSVTNFGTSSTTTCYSTSCVTGEACSKTEAAGRPSDGAVPLLGAGGDAGYTYITGTRLAPKSAAKPKAHCQVEIFDIEGWATDLGRKLLAEERGCGALTGWEWHQATLSTPAWAAFNLPLILAPRCVERAIVSSGGPLITCYGV